MPVVVDRRVEEEPLPLPQQYHRLHKNGHYPPDCGRNQCKIETFLTSLSGFIRAAIMAYRKDRFNGV